MKAIAGDLLRRTGIGLERGALAYLSKPRRRSTRELKSLHPTRADVHADYVSACLHPGPRRYREREGDP